MTITRRDLLKATMSAAALAAVPRPLLAHLGRVPELVPPVSDPRMKELALRALDAAVGAGAGYADVRLTHTRTRDFDTDRPVNGIVDSEEMSVGVRVLVDGYWGFAGSSIWTPDEMIRLGREAVLHAKVMAMGPARQVSLVSTSRVEDGHWQMPVDIDPFEISPFEILDYLISLETFAERLAEVKARSTARFRVQEKAFASSDGSYCTQRLYRAEGSFPVQLYENGQPVAGGALDVLTPAGVGWELFKGQPLRDHIERLVEELKEDAKLPVSPVDVGRHPVVCDALSVARLVDETLGRATELDRALGYESNAGGTSYLNDPLAMLGAFQAGPPGLTLAADRTEKGGAATVRWDDEGVESTKFTLIEGGVLRDFQTTRESAGWIADFYHERGQEVRSNGCAAAPTAVDAPLQHPPNLALAPGTGPGDFDEAIAEMGTGIAVRNLGVDMDFQGLNGLGISGRVYEIKNGARVARIAGAGFLFRAPELWKALGVLGNGQSLRRYGLETTKGEPPQQTCHSVTAPLAVFEQLTVIDATRKA